MDKISINLSNFPKPKCWDDNIRMGVMFSPFRPRAVNPENYAAKLRFWREMIQNYCEHKGSPEFKKEELEEVFIRKGLKPKCLEIVIEDMFTEKELRSKVEFITDPLNTWSQWAINRFVKNPLKWGFSFIVNPTPEQSETFIHLDLLKKMAKSLLEKLSNSYSGQVISLDKVLETGKSIVNREGGILSLKYLHARGDIFMSSDTEKEICLVKIPDKNKNVAALTQVDYSIYELRKSQENANQILDKIDSELQENDKKARQYLREDKREMAKSCLRRKKLLQEKSKKWLGVLDNIENLLNSVSEAQNNSEVLDVYKYSSAALKNLMIKNRLSVENVDDIMSDMKETIDTNKEIEEAMNVPVIESNEDDTALLDELNELMSAGKDKVNNNITNIQKSDKPKVDKYGNSDEELLDFLEKLEIEHHDPELEKENLPNKSALTKE